MANHISPCSVATGQIASELDNAIISKDIVVLNEHINEALVLAESEDAISKATIYYCLGTVYAH